MWVEEESRSGPAFDVDALRVVARGSTVATIPLSSMYRSNILETQSVIQCDPFFQLERVQAKRCTNFPIARVK
jgi:hypothetical protein